MQYIDVPIDTDPEDILSDAYTYLQSVIPGWQPSQGQLDVWLLQAISSAAAELKDVASAVPTNIFRWYGANLVGLPPIDATPATTTVTVNAVDLAGYTIHDGTQLSIDKTGDVSVAFEIIGDWVIPVGQNHINGVTIRAVDAGTSGTNLGVIGGVVHLLDPLTWVTTITQEAVTSGGVDAEADDTYLSRLAAELQLLAPRPILPNDFAVLARNVAGVYRATAIDGYNPAAGGSFGNARTVAVAAVDQNGNAVSAPVKAAIQASLQAQREINFIVNAIDPTLSYIDVTYKVKALAGFDTAALVLAVNAAIQGYLNPATWGTLPGQGVQDWTNLTVVRYLELAQVINSVDGVDYITTTAGNYDLQIAIHGNALGRADIALPGVAPLASAGAPAVINGTAT